MPLSESQVTAQVRDFLELRGWRAIRMQRAVVPGMFQSGEPGMPDFLFLHYDKPGWALVLWIEMKRPGARMNCRCSQNRGTRRRCTPCDQRNWKERERLRGAVVITVSDFSAFEAEYSRAYGWLHTGERARGQMRLA